MPACSTASSTVRGTSSRAWSPELTLSVPTTWEEFAANNEAIKEAGLVALGRAIHLPNKKKAAAQA